MLRAREQKFAVVGAELSCIRVAQRCDQMYPVDADAMQCCCLRVEIIDAEIVYVSKQKEKDSSVLEDRGGTPRLGGKVNNDVVKVE